MHQASNKLPADTDKPFGIVCKLSQRLTQIYYPVPSDEDVSFVH